MISDFPWPLNKQQVLLLLWSIGNDWQFGQEKQLKWIWVFQEAVIEAMTGRMGGGKGVGGLRCGD